MPSAVAQGLDLATLPPETLNLLRCQAALRLGNARPYIEAFFSIKDVHGALVPMRFLPLQRQYDAAMFGGGWKPGEPREGVWVKARKATVSAYATAIDTAYFLGIPGYDVAVIANSEDTLAPLSNMVNTFYDNMPAAAKPMVYKQVWGTERRQVVFQDPATGKTIVNTMVMSSSNSPNFGRGYTIRIVHLDELAFFVNTFDAAALQNSVGGNAIWFRVSTANGHDKHFYPAVQSARRRTNRSQVYIFNEWWANPENWYGDEDLNRRSEDVGDLTPGEAVGLPPDLLRDEPFIVPKLPAGKSASGYLAFRRRKLQDALLQNANDATAALSHFFAEYPEDETQPFENLLNAQFDRLRLTDQLHAAEQLLVAKQEASLGGGLLFRAWELPQIGHSYACSLDLGGSEKETSDPSSLQIKDLTTGVYVAEMHGRQETRFVIQESVRWAIYYNRALLVIDTTGLGNGEANWAASYKQPGGSGLGYERVWRRERLPHEQATDRTYRERDYGWKIGAQTRLDMLKYGREHFNNGRVRRILNADLLRDMQGYNPDGTNEHQHFPDRVSAFLQLEAVDPVPAAGGLYGAEAQQGPRERLSFPPRRLRALA